MRFTTGQAERMCRASLVVLNTVLGNARNSDHRRPVRAGPALLRSSGLVEFVDERSYR